MLSRMFSIIIGLISLVMLSWPAFAHNDLSNTQARRVAHNRMPIAEPSPVEPLPGPVPPAPWPSPDPNPILSGPDVTVEYVSCGHDFLAMAYCPLEDDAVYVSLYKMYNGICTKDINWGFADGQIWVKGCFGVFAVARRR